jgi:hypothetical protein
MANPPVGLPAQPGSHGFHRQVSAEYRTVRVRSRWRSIPHSARDALALLLLATTLIAVCYAGIGRGTFAGFDEARHIMDGVFFADFYRDMPLSHIYQYATEYFVRFPALSLNWNPPMFPAIVGLFMLASGPDPILIRVLVLCFAMVGLLTWYFWTSRFWGQGIAFLSALIFATQATIHSWATAIMLDIPVVALMVCALLALARYVSRPSLPRATIVGLLLAAMLLTKQTSLFILPLFVLGPILAGRADLLWSRTGVPVYTLVFVACAILVIHAWALGSVGIAERLGDLSERAGAPPRLSLERWLLYASVVRDSFAWPVLALALAGCIEAIRRRTPGDVLILVWLMLWYVAFTITSADPQDALRYATYVAAPISLLAARSIGLLSGANLLTQGAVVAAVLVVIAWTGYESYRTPLPAMSDLRAPALLASQEAGDRPVLYCCRFDGEFIFDRRLLDPGRRGITLRADKILVNFSIEPAYGVTSYANSPDDILALLDRYGVAVLAIESSDNLHVPQFALLREIVSGPKFELIGEFPITKSYVPVPPDLSLRLYRYRNVQTPLDGVISVPVPQLDTTLKLHGVP